MIEKKILIFRIIIFLKINFLIKNIFLSVINLFLFVKTVYLYVSFGGKRMSIKIFQFVNNFFRPSKQIPLNIKPIKQILYERKLRSNCGIKNYFSMIFTGIISRARILLNIDLVALCKLLKYQPHIQFAYTQKYLKSKPCIRLTPAYIQIKAIRYIFVNYFRCTFEYQQYLQR